MGITANSVTKIRSIKLGSWLGALLSLSVGVALHFITSEAVENDARSRFGHMARNVQLTLESRFKTYADLLRGTASLFSASGEVTRDAFGRYVNALDLPHNFPGVESINFARYLRDAERGQFEAQMLQNIDGRGRNARIMPAGRRAEYTVLTFVEPGAAWISRIGFDMQTVAGGVRVLGRSRDTGELLTGGSPVKSGSKMLGLAMRLPVYRAAMPVQDVTQRRAAYLGTVGVGFSVDRLAHGVLDTMPKNATRLAIFGMAPVEEAGRSPTVYRRVVYFDNRAGVEPDERTEFHALLPVGADGRGWDIDFSVKKRSLYSSIDNVLPWVAMLAGMTSTALLYALFQTLSFLAPARHRHCRGDDRRIARQPGQAANIATTTCAAWQRTPTRSRKGTQAHRPRNPRRPRPEPAGAAHRGRHARLAHRDAPPTPARARTLHARPDRRHDQERAPDHQRPASERARPGPERRRSNGRSPSSAGAPAWSAS